MAKCDICGKGVTFGIKVSHSHRRSNRTWKPPCKGSDQWYPVPCQRLLSVPPFRQGYPCNLIRELTV